MKTIKNSKNRFLKAFPALVVIATAVFALTLFSDEAPPIQPETQAEPEQVNLETITFMLPETPPPVITTTPPITTTEPPVTTTPQITTSVTPPTTTSPPATTTTVPISTTITMSTPLETTAPPPQMPDGAQGIDENGWYYKVENGQKYVWHSILG